MVDSKIMTWNPVERFFYFVQEREAVRLNREANKPKPWTKDVILQSYRFCNIRRMDDKVSLWLYDNWYKPYFNHPDMLLAIAIARFLNKPESLELIGFPSGISSWPDYKKEAKEILRRVQKHKPIFNGAYMVRGNDGKDKLSSVFDHYVQSLVKAGLNTILVRHSMEDTWSNIVNCYGFGSFMAGQIVADARWAIRGTWEDKYTWAPIGPGSKRGMNRYLGRATNAPLSQSEFLKELTDVMKRAKKIIKPVTYNRLEAHDWQNCFCEWDKHERILWGEGRPKQRYDGEKD